MAVIYFIGQFQPELQAFTFVSYNIFLWLISQCWPQIIADCCNHL